MCADCGKHCVSVSDTTMRTLTGPTEIIFRSPQSARARIEQQDSFLKTRCGPDGRSWYQIISDVLDGTPPALDIDDEPPSDSDGLQAIDD